MKELRHLLLWLLKPMTGLPQTFNRQDQGEELKHTFVAYLFSSI